MSAMVGSRERPGDGKNREDSVDSRIDRLVPLG